MAYAVPRDGASGTGTVCLGCILNTAGDEGVLNTCKAFAIRQFLELLQYHPSGQDIIRDVASRHAPYALDSLAHVLAGGGGADAGVQAFARELALLLVSGAPFMPEMLMQSLTIAVAGALERGSGCGAPTEAVRLMDQLCEDTGATHTLADTLARHAGCHTVSEWLIELVVHPDTKVAHAATSVWARLLAQQPSQLLPILRVASHALIQHASHALVLLGTSSSHAGAPEREKHALMLLQLMACLLEAGPGLAAQHPSAHNAYMDSQQTASLLMASMRPCLVGSSAAVRASASQLLADICCSATLPGLLKHLVQADACEYLFEALRSYMTSEITSADGPAACLKALQGLARYQSSEFQQRCLCGVDVLIRLLRRASSHKLGDLPLQVDLLILLEFVVQPGHDLSVATADVSDLLDEVAELFPTNSHELSRAPAATFELSSDGIETCVLAARIITACCKRWIHLAPVRPLLLQAILRCVHGLVLVGTTSLRAGYLQHASKALACWCTSAHGDSAPARHGHDELLHSLDLVEGIYLPTMLRVVPDLQQQADTLALAVSALAGVAEWAEEAARMSEPEETDADTIAAATLAFRQSAIRAGAHIWCFRILDAAGDSTREADARTLAWQCLLVLANRRDGAALSARALSAYGSMESALQAAAGTMALGSSGNATCLLDVCAACLEAGEPPLPPEVLHSTALSFICRAGSCGGAWRGEEHQRTPWVALISAGLRVAMLSEEALQSQAQGGVWAEDNQAPWPLQVDDLQPTLLSFLAATAATVRLHSRVGCWFVTHGSELAECAMKVVLDDCVAGSSCPEDAAKLLVQHAHAVGPPLLLRLLQESIKPGQRDGWPVPQLLLRMAHVVQLVPGDVPALLQDGLADVARLCVLRSTRTAGSSGRAHEELSAALHLISELVATLPAVDACSACLQFRVAAAAHVCSAAGCLMPLPNAEASPAEDAGDSAATGAVPSPSPQVKLQLLQLAADVAAQDLCASIQYGTEPTSARRILASEAVAATVRHAIHTRPLLGDEQAHGMGLAAAALRLTTLRLCTEGVCALPDGGWDWGFIMAELMDLMAAPAALMPLQPHVLSSLWMLLLMRPLPHAPTHSTRTLMMLLQNGAVSGDAHLRMHATIALLLVPPACGDINALLQSPWSTTLLRASLDRIGDADTSESICLGLTGASDLLFLMAFMQPLLRGADPLGCLNLVASSLDVGGLLHVLLRCASPMAQGAQSSSIGGPACCSVSACLCQCVCHGLLQLGLLDVHLAMAWDTLQGCTATQAHLPACTPASGRRCGDHDEHILMALLAKRGGRLGLDPTAPGNMVPSSALLAAIEARMQAPPDFHPA